MELLSIASFLKNGHQFEIFIYDKYLKVPYGAVMRDANEIIPYNRVFKDSRGTYASFADWFRFKMLFQLGGWWSDLDSICLRPFHVEKEYCFSSEGNEIKFIANCGNIKAPKHSEFLDECLFEIDKLLQLKDYTWGKFGVNLMRKILPHYDHTDYLLTPKYFCPIPYTHTAELISSTPPIIPQESFAIHFWNEIWRLKTWDKNGIYPSTSLFEQLKQKYLSA